MEQGLWLPLFWARLSLGQESGPATQLGGPRCLEDPLETSQTQVPCKAHFPQRDLGWRGPLKCASLSPLLPATCLQSHGGLRVLGGEPSTDPGEGRRLTVMEPQDCTQHLPVPPERPRQDTRSPFGR